MKNILQIICFFGVSDSIFEGLNKIIHHKNLLDMNIISVDDQDVRSNNSSNFELAVNSAVQAGKKVGVYWERNSYYGGKIIAAEISDNDPPPTAIAKKVGDSYELKYL